MINEKMRALGVRRSTIRELFEYGRKRKAEIGDENVFDFSLGNPSVPAPSEVTKELIRLLTECDATSLHAYTSAQGDLAVREAIADYVTEKSGVSTSADNIYMSVGAAGALTSALSALVNEGEEVIVLTPYFPEYKVFIEKAGGVVREVPTHFGSFMPSLEAIEEAISEKTAAIIINSPNNPTGAVYPKEVLIALSELLCRKERELSKSIYLISDEPYRELVYDGIEVPYPTRYYDNTVVCYSFSKSLSLPGERIGYVLVSPRAKDSKDVYAAVMGAGRALGFVCAPSLLQRLIPRCLGKTSDIAVYDENRRILYSALTEYGYELTHPDGAFYLFMKAPGGDSVAFSEAAKRYDLLLVPGDDFGACGYLRIAYCVETERIKRSLPAFLKLIKEYERKDS